MRPSIIAVSALGALVAAPALAAGPLDAAPDPVVVPPAEPVPAPSFAGPYVGGSVGYGALDASDAEGILEQGFAPEFIEDTFDLERGDLAYGAHAGYNVRRGSVVFGPELAVFGGEVGLGGMSDFDDELPEEMIDVDINYGARVALRGGVERGRTWFYGTLGAAYLDLSIATDGVQLARDSRDRDGWGYAAGVGVERLVSDRVSVGAQYTLHHFDDFDLGYGHEADVEHRTLDLRVSLNF